MTSREWSRGFRLLLGFLVAPAVVPFVSLFMLSAIGGARHVDSGVGVSSLLGCIVHPGILLSYACAILFGLLYVLLTRRTKRLDFWAFATMALWLGLMFFALLSAVSETIMPFIGGMLVFVPSIFLSLLCFYLVGVWRS